MPALRWRPLICQFNARRQSPIDTYLHIYSRVACSNGKNYPWWLWSWWLKSAKKKQKKNSLSLNIQFWKPISCVKALAQQYNKKNSEGERESWAKHKLRLAQKKFRRCFKSHKQEACATNKSSDLIWLDSNSTTNLLTAISLLPYLGKCMLIYLNNK